MPSGSARRRRREMNDEMTTNGHDLTVAMNFATGVPNVLFKAVSMGFLA